MFNLSAVKCFLALFASLERFPLLNLHVIKINIEPMVSIFVQAIFRFNASQTQAWINWLLTSFEEVAWKHNRRGHIIALTRPFGFVFSVDLVPNVFNLIGCNCVPDVILRMQFLFVWPVFICVWLQWLLWKQLFSPVPFSLSVAELALWMKTLSCISIFRPAYICLIRKI